MKIECLILSFYIIDTGAVAIEYLSRGLMVESRTRNRKVASSSLGPTGIAGGGS